MSVKTSFQNLCEVLNTMLASKVDKVSGKGLSTNDYTTAEKNKLAGIATGANKTTVDATFSSTSTNPVQNKVISAAIDDIGTQLDTKVDKVSGKGLSANDYTTAEKNKLSGIATGANKTVLEDALSTTSTNGIQNKAVALKFQGIDSDITGINSTLKTKADASDLATVKSDLSKASTTAGNAATAAAAVKKDLADNYYNKTTVDSKISTIPKFAITVVESLPDSNISVSTVYLLKGTKEETQNMYDEYIYITGTGWEKLGTQTMDLSGYATTAAMNTALGKKVDKVSGKGLSTNDFTKAYKDKLDGIATGANKTTVDTALSTTSANPVENRVVAGQFAAIAPDITDLKSSVTNINKSITDITTDTATISKDTFTTWLTATATA